MSITNLAIKYRTSIVALTLLIVVGGLYSYLTIPKESAPSIEIPTIVVTSIYPGASPDDVESVVTQPVEQEIGSISGIEELRSTSTEGVSSIVVEFTPDVNLDKAYQEVNQAVDRAQSELPDAVEDPSVDEIDTSEFPIMTVNLTASYSLARLKEVAKDLQDKVEGLPSILEANLVGGLTREVRINADLRALRSRNLSLQSLIQTIEAENTNIPGGSIDVGDQSFLVRVDGQFENPADQIEDLVVAAPNGKPVYVRDVADVVFGFKDRETYARLQTLQRENAEGAVRPAKTTETRQVISLSVKKRPGDNILDAVENVKETLREADLPSGTGVIVTGDESENVRSLVTDLENNIISGLIFVVAVLLFFMGVRNAVLVGIAIPLSMFTSFIFFQAAGYTFNFIILFSLIIALGMLVDNAVVIVENIYRYHENGYSKLEAARLGTAEVGGAVVAATATTVSVFAPMLFWPGTIGEFMGYMPLTLIVTLTCSLFVALIVNPVITGIFVKVEGEDEGAGERERGGAGETSHPTNQRPGWLRWVATGAVAFTALVLAFVSWQTLVVLAVGVPLLYYGYVKVLKPVGDRFMAEGMPRLVARYRSFLRDMLDRDYGPRNGRADSASGYVNNSADDVRGVRSFLTNRYTRNMGALGALVAGMALCALGGAVFAATRIGGMLLLAPGGLLLAVGVLGILFHTLEMVFLGGWTSVKAAGGFAAVCALLLAVQLPGGDVALPTLLMIVAFPLLLAAVGFYGALHRQSSGGALAGTVDAVLLVLASFLVVAAVLGGLGSSLSSVLSDAAVSGLPEPVAVGLPLGIAALIGMVATLGRLYQRRARSDAPAARPPVRRLVLTDNRAVLLNSSVGLLLIIVCMFALQPTGVSFFPETDPSRVQVTLDAPIGTNVEASNRVAAAAHDSLTALLANDDAARGNVKNIVINVGIGEDAAFGGEASRPRRSRLSLNFVDFAQRAEPTPATLRSLRNRLSGFPGVEMDFTKEQQGPPTGAPVNIEISGPDFEKLLSISNEIQSRMREAAERGEIPGLVDVTDDANAGRPEVQVNIDRERANAYGLSTAGIAREVRAAIEGTEASKYRDGEDEYDITVRAREADRQQIESLESLMINTPAGTQIPLSSIATLGEGSGLGSITRLDEQRVITVTGDAAPGVNGQAVLGKVQNLLSEYQQDLPPGYSLEYTGANEEQQESFGFLGVALAVGVSLILMVMIAEFNSISAPFIIIVAVGLSMIGVLLGLILTRTPFSLFTFIGIISLAGIVVNNNIVLVDYVMQLRQQGMDKQDAIIEGGATRLRPVLLTALTTILGLVPLTFGINVDFVGLLAELEPDFQIGSENTQFWGPMGTAIIAGLLFGTFLTLVIVPVMYSTFDSLSVRAARLFGGNADDAGITSEAVATVGGVATAPDGSELQPAHDGNGAPAGDQRPPDPFAPGDGYDSEEGGPHSGSGAAPGDEEERSSPSP
jgi:multidrug efflux pump subunit AcrB